MTPQDESLTARLVALVGREGEGEFAPLYARIAPALHAWARLRLQGPLAEFVQPEDVVQEVWCRAWRGWKNYDKASGGFRAWVFGIAGHVLLEALRSYHRKAAGDGRRIELSSTGAGEIPALAMSISRAIARDDALSVFLEHLVYLDATDRQILVLRGLEERTIEEVALLVGLSGPATRKRWDRLRDKIREFGAPFEMLRD